jgi:hypothetical protein
VLGFSPTVGKRDQVHAEAFDTGYFSRRDVVTKSIAVEKPTASLSVASITGSLAGTARLTPGAARQVEVSHI